MSRRRTNSAKWKEVLGFDDGSSTLSSPRIHSPSASMDTTQSVKPTSKQSARPAYPRLPRDITFFSTRGGMLLSPSSPAPSPNDDKPLPAPPPLCYIAIQKEPISEAVTARPDIILHSGPSKAAPIICFAKFHSVAASTDMTFCASTAGHVSANCLTADSTSTNSSFSSTSSGAVTESERPRFKIESLQSTIGIFSTGKYTFSHTHSRTLMRDRYEWRSSSRSFIRSFDEDQATGGLKLIQVRTGDVIAVYAGLRQSSRGKAPSRVVGMFRFLKRDASCSLEEELEVLAVISLLSIVERAKRSFKAHHFVFG